MPPLRLSVDPPLAEALPDSLICKPLRGPVRFPAVRVVAPTVLPTAVVDPPTTFPAVVVVVFKTLPAVLPTPPSRPPLPREPALERVFAGDCDIVSVSILAFPAWAELRA